MEYSFTEPAFDMFGRQTQFIASKDANNVHYGTNEKTLHRPVRKRSGW